MILNSSNVEELVLRNSAILNKLPHLSDSISLWQMGQFVPGLRAVAQKAKLDFLNKLTERDITIIRDHIKVTELTVEKLDYETVKNYTVGISEVQDFLTTLELEKGYFCVSRDADHFYLCKWK